MPANAPQHDQTSRFVSKSTQAFIREAQRTDSYSFFDLLHGYFYARWPYLYIGVGVGEHPLARVLVRINAFLDQVLPRRRTAPPNSGNVADTYHGKVVTTEGAGKLLRIKEPIQLRNLEQVIPYPIAKDIIMTNPDHIVALECPCRQARENPCTPLDVCLIVGEPFASFVIEHHPDKARWIDAEDGMGILEAEAERGHVHHAFFKDAMLGRFYAICNCCSCCCGAMQLNRNGIPMLASSGYLSAVDVDHCGSCGSCVEICPFGAIRFDGRFPDVQFEECMGCGVCVRHCPDDALKLVTEPEKGVPLEMDLLLQSDGVLS